MDIKLLSNGFADITPNLYRSPGIHVSTLLDRICTRYGHYQKTVDKSGNPIPISSRNATLGHAFEEMIVQMTERKYPGQFIHNPEVECDGLYITPDLVGFDPGLSWSQKATWMSPANGPEDTKMWKYLEQLKAELYCLRRVCNNDAKIRCACVSSQEVKWVTGDDLIMPTVRTCDMLGVSHFLTGFLTVCFINDFRPEEEQIPTWEIKFWPEELEMTWAMVMDEKTRMEAEG